MKLIPVIFTAALLSLAEMGSAQGFINLDFESPTFVSANGFYVQFNQAFPGWTGTVGGVQQTLALSNAVYLDSAGISIINGSYHARLPVPGGVIQGDYTAILYSGLNPNTGTPSDVTLSQTGFVPIGTESLLFEAFDSHGTFTVTLSGQALSLSALGTGANYTLYGADVSSFAGQTEQLSFTVSPEIPHQNDEYLYLDAIQFSTQPIPEPSAFALAALGALFLGFSRRMWQHSA